MTRMELTVRCPDCGYRGRVPDTQKTWTCRCRHRWQVARTIETAADAAAGSPQAAQRSRWRWPQFFWTGLVTQFLAAVVFGAAVANADSNGFGDAEPNAGAVIVALLLGWIGTIWLLVGIGAWAVQVGTLDLRRDVAGLLTRQEDGSRL